MTFVIDASVALSWNYPDEGNRYSEAVLATLVVEKAVAPIIFWFEIRNVLLLGERRARSTKQATDDFLGFLQTLSIAIAPLPSEGDILGLARRHRLTFYDAAYLELAQREQIALATLDQSLARAAAAEGVPLIAA